MRATRTSVFIQAIILAILGFKHEWAAVMVPLGILHLAYHWASSPRLVPADRSDHYRIHRGREPKNRFPSNPTPDRPHWQ